MNAHLYVHNSLVITTKLMESTCPSFWVGVEKMNKQSYKANPIYKNVKKEITS